MRLSSFFSTLAALVALPASAYTIDGNLADWGISSPSFTPSLPVKGYVIEDQTGGANTFLNPGYGGQPYDAEALYVNYDSTNLYLGLITGHSPQNTSYAPGDFLIDFGHSCPVKTRTDSIGC